MYIYLQTLEGWDKTPRIFIDLIGKIRQLNVHKLSFKLYAEDTVIEFNWILLIFCLLFIGFSASSYYKLFFL